MSVDNGIHVGDIGTVFVLSVTENGAVVDLSGCTSISFTFKAPDNTSYSLVGQVNTDGTDGKIKYERVQGDGLFSVPGKWKVQAVLQWMPSGVLKSYSTSTYEFTVFENV